MKKVYEFIHNYKLQHGVEKTADVNVKFIASSKTYGALDEYFKSIHVEYKAKLIEDDFVFEVYCYGESAKLRISKSGDKATAMRKSTIKVLVVDDSPTIIKLLKI